MSELRHEGQRVSHCSRESGAIKQSLLAKNSQKKLFAEDNLRLGTTMGRRTE
jgi:hypothetical protein